MTEKLRVGIIGAGSIANLHIQSYLSLPDEVKIVAVCDVVPEKAQAIAEKYNLPQVYTDYRKMLELESFDVVSICTPPFAHAPVAVAALEAGAHVLCEKPMALNADEAHSMVEAAKRAEKMLVVGLQYRFDPRIQSLKQFIEAGELGKVYYGRAWWLRRRGIPSWGSYTRKEKSGGGVLVDLGVHVLDLALWLMGQPQPLRVFGVTCAGLVTCAGPLWWPWEWWTEAVGQPGPPPDRSAFDVEDFATALVRFEDSTTLSLEASWALNISRESFGCVLCGTEGGAELTLLPEEQEPLHLYQRRAGAFVDVTSRLERYVLEAIQRHQAMIRHFVTCIKDGVSPAPLATGEEGLMICRITDAIYASATRGEAVILA